MKRKINNGAVLDAVATISNHCESIMNCDNCILKKLCLTILSGKMKSIPYYWMDCMARKDNNK